MYKKQINWRDKYKNLKDFYKNEYDSKYYDFSNQELEIDPSESLEEIEAYSTERKLEEMIKCINSFSYFCHKYIKISNPKYGMIPFILFKYQKRYIEECENNKLNIANKFRQGGFSTIAAIWGLWKCMFSLDQSILFLNRTDREAVCNGKIVEKSLDQLPNWLKPKMGKNNHHHKSFTETDSKLIFSTIESCVGYSLTNLIIDEAAFIEKMEIYWESLQPYISTVANCMIISTHNVDNNWFKKTLNNAETKENNFNIIKLNYLDHPEYNNLEWKNMAINNLGEECFNHEFFCCSD